MKLNINKGQERYSIKFLIKEFLLFISGYYTKLKTLVFASWYIHCFLWISISMILISWVAYDSLFNYLLNNLTTDEKKVRLLDWKLFIYTPDLKQYQLFLFTLYYISYSIHQLFWGIFFIFLYAKIFLALSFYKHEINVSDKCKTRIFLDLLWNPIFPIYSYKKLNNKKLIYLHRKPKISITSLMNNMLKFQKFPEINKKELVRIKNLSFLYHSDNDWDKYFHLFLKKYFPNLYQRHIIKKNTLRPSEISTKTISNIKALKNINLDIFSSKFTTILGCNGSSKTTLLKSMINLFESYEGSILWINKDLKTISSKSFFKNVSYIPQNWDKNIQITLYEFVSYSLFSDMPFFKFNFPKDHPEIIKNIKKMNLYEYKDKKISSLSGGEKQRAILARALTQKTNVIILDEPTTYLDIKNQYLILKILKDLQEKENKTIITILHDLQQAKQFSDYIVLLNSGEVYATGKTNNVMTESNINYLFK